MPINDNAYLEYLVTSPNPKIMSGRFDITHKNSRRISAQNVQSQSLHRLVGRDIPWFTRSFHVICRNAKMYDNVIPDQTENDILW